MTKEKDRRIFYNVYRKALRLGLIKKERCAKCNGNYKIHGHHEDYTQPLKVIWLCAKHHYALHSKIKREKEKFILKAFKITSEQDAKVKKASKLSGKGESAIIRSLIDEIHDDQTKN